MVGTALAPHALNANASTVAMINMGFISLFLPFSLSFCL